MAHVETYSYGQGKLYLAVRDAMGNIGAQRWVGDVSELSISLTVESFEHSESYSGTRQKVRKIITGKSGEVSAKFHEFSAENLSLLLLGEVTKVSAGSVTGEALPAVIKAGDRIALVHQDVSEVKIGTLVEGTDYTVDPIFGAIEFLKDIAANTDTVAYKYGEVTIIAMLTNNPKDLFLRYEGLNLAENNEWNVVELYKINFTPTEALNLINNDNSLDALSTKATVLADTNKVGDATFGRFGRVIKIRK